MTEHSITNSQLLNTLMQAINAVKEEIKNKNEELKQEIKIENKKVLDKLEEHNARINTLTKSFENVEIRCLALDRTLRKNNILIFGLKVPSSGNLLNFTLNKLNELLGVELQESDINNIYQLKSEAIAPIKIEFVTFLKKNLVIKNRTKLKGSKIFIEHDLCPEDRQDQKILTHHLKEARSKNYLAKIKGKTLIVNNETYTLQELKNIDSQEDQRPIFEKVRTTSAPTTPISPILEQTIINTSNYEEIAAKEPNNYQHTLTAQENKEDRKKNEKTVNTSPADLTKEEKSKIKRTDSTSSTKREKTDRPKRYQKSPQI